MQRRGSVDESNKHGTAHKCFAVDMFYGQQPLYLGEPNAPRKGTVPHTFKILCTSDEPAVADDLFELPAVLECTRAKSLHVLVLHFFKVCAILKGVSFDLFCLWSQNHLFYPRIVFVRSL